MSKAYTYILSLVFLLVCSVGVFPSHALATSVTVDNPLLVWSPYTWHINGSTWAETSPGGAYVKLAFSGSTLGIVVDTSAMSGVNLGDVIVNAYIDGSTTPITKTLADADGNGLIEFATALSAGDHYAQIYLSQTPQAGDRWTGPAEVLRIASIELASDGSGNLLSLAGTPLEEKLQKILIFGDSITEGIGTTYDERSYAAVMGRQLGMEYGQVGYGYLGWSQGGTGGTPQFYDSVSPTNSLWRHYNANASRMVDTNDISAGFVDGTPDVVVVNLGINDANIGTGASAMRTKVSAWLTETRLAIGQNPTICVIVPFNFGHTNNTNYANYKAALLAGVTDYQSGNPSDQNICVLNLGVWGYATVVVNSSDSLHPNDTGSALIGSQLATLMQNVLVPADTTAPTITNVSASSITKNSATITWTTDEPATSQVVYGTTASYGTQTAIDATLATSHSVIVSGLSPTTTYHYRVSSDDGQGNNAQSADDTFTTMNQPSSGGGGGTSGAIGSVNVDQKETPIVVTIPPVETPSAPAAVLQSNACPPHLTITDSLRMGNRSPQVALLQQHINRILKAQYDSAAGPIDGIFGPLTRQGVVRLQTVLRDQLQADLGPAGTDGIVGPFTRSAINNSCPAVPENIIAVTSVHL